MLIENSKNHLLQICDENVNKRRAALLWAALPVTVFPMKEGAFTLPEVETKIIEVDRIRDESRLLQLGAKRVSDKELVAVWMEGHGKKFRVRDEGGDVKVESKAALFSSGGVKACQEVGFGADSFDGAIRFFESLGFAETSRNVKNRVTYLLGLEC